MGTTVRGAMAGPCHVCRILFVSLCLCVWDIDTGKESARWSTPEFFVSCLDISSDGRYLVESGGSNAVVVRELATQKVVQTLRGHEAGWIMCCRFLKDSPLIATSCSDKTVRVWDVGDGRELLAIRGLKHYQFGLSFSPSGTLLAAGSGGDQRDGKWWVGEDFCVRLWKLPKTIWRRRTGPITVAVLGFETTGTSPAQARLRETLADLLTVELGQLDTITLVERQGLQAVLQEQHLQAAQLTDPATAIRLGQLAGADWVLVGSLSGEGENLKMSVRVVDVATSRILTGREQAVAVGQVDQGLAKLIAGLQHDLFPNALPPAAKPKSTTPVISTHSLEYASLMARARRLHVEKKTTEAATAYEQALLLQESSVEARLELLRCRTELKQWEPLLEVAHSLRDQPGYKTMAAYVRYEVARAEIDALARLKRAEEIRRRGSDWERECEPFKADIARAWKRAAGIREVETAGSLQFATEVHKHGHRSEALRKLYIDAFLRLRKGSVDKQLAACQDVVVVVDHVLKVCADKRDADIQRWARTLIPNGIEMVTYYEIPGGEQMPFLTVDQKIERLERAWQVFGWMPTVQYEILAKLSCEQRMSGRYDAASESYLKLARAPFPEPDRLPAELDHSEREPTTILDRRINGWAGWALMRAKVVPESTRSALETALVEIGAVHERGPELIAAASEANIPDFYYGGPSSADWYEKWKPLNDTFQNHPSRRQTLSISLRDIAQQQLQRMKAK